MSEQITGSLTSWSSEPDEEECYANKQIAADFDKYNQPKAVFSENTVGNLI